MLTISEGPLGPGGRPYTSMAWSTVDTLNFPPSGTLGRTHSAHYLGKCLCPGWPLGKGLGLAPNRPEGLHGGQWVGWILLCSDPNPKPHPDPVLHAGEGRIIFFGGSARLCNTVTVLDTAYQMRPPKDSDPNPNLTIPAAAASGDVRY